MHPLAILACILLGAVAVAQVSSFWSPPDAARVDAAPVQGGAGAAPNADPQPVGPAQPSAAATVAMPYHDPPRLRPRPTFALNPAPLPAAPEPAAPTAAAFAAADTALYARDGARLRAAPSISADILAKLAADAPLRATGRSTDGEWWRVSLAGGRTAYVHRIAVSQSRMAKTKPPAAKPAPAVAAPQPAPARRSQGLLGYVDRTMDWLAETADRGSAPTAARTER